MTFGSILYQLFISPITLLLEVVFALFFSVLNSCGVATGQTRSRMRSAAARRRWRLLSSISRRPSRAMSAT